MPKLKQNKITTTNPQHYRNALAWPAIRNTNHFPEVSTQAAKHHSTRSNHPGEDEWELAVLMALWSSCSCCIANENRHKLQFWNTQVSKNWEVIWLTVGGREQEGHQTVCTVNVDKVQRMIRIMEWETTKQNMPLQPGKEMWQNFVMLQIACIKRTRKSLLSI